MAIYAMSDIHGMYEPFMRRIRQLGNLQTIKNGQDQLVLLGDYVDVGPDSRKVLEIIYALQQEAGEENLIVLMGNHDKWFLDFVDGKNNDWIIDPMCANTLGDFLSAEEKERMRGLKPDVAVSYIQTCIKKRYSNLIRWLRHLPLYYKTEHQIFVHAGVDEEAEDWWELGTSEEMFLEKYPPSKGDFYMTIIAGHVSTAAMSKDVGNHDIYFDGHSHYYIDGIDSYPVGTKPEERTIPLLVYEKRKGKEVYASMPEKR